MSGPAAPGFTGPGQVWAPPPPASQWTHRGPAAPRSGGASGESRAEAAAWVAASAPLVGLVAAVVVGVMFPGLGIVTAVSLGLLVGWGCGALVAVIDRRLLRALGEDPAHWAWSLIAPWAYLLARALRRRPASWTTWTALGLCVGLTFLSAVLAPPLTRSVRSSTAVFNRDQVQQDVAAEVERQTGIPVIVSCPEDPPLSAGSSFHCAVRGDDLVAVAVVTMADDSGGYTWILM
ncbi:DUF4333 domain-containing protein [Parafrankia sp. EUN1f]|uniref:DUF4333 domain-containing protein n=1 Tax=Parafrankia sp. EUN1f TaxID=102897 RepID=UPI0001C463EC|nr:DUF4333 domain-containing protein [Parafrankia sp. EUN1f]EFC81187.1 hypothetical protein FrEUN1fDRAFT_5716 [Parafrankia sp. EUN1f]